MTQSAEAASPHSTRFSARFSARSYALARLVAAVLTTTAAAGCDSQTRPQFHNGASAAQANGVELAERGYRRYDLERAVVHYRITGDEEATETLYFDHWGMREARLRQAVGVGETTLQLIDGDTTYVVEIATKRATAQPTAQIPGTAVPLTDLGKRRRAWFESLGGKPVGRGRVAGRSCERWETPALRTITCLWKSLPLATETRLDGAHQRRVAVQIDVAPQIPEERFALPPGIRIAQSD